MAASTRPGRRALRQARPGREDPPGRPGRERAATAGRRRGRFRHGLQQLHSAEPGARPNVPLRAVMAIFQKDPQVLITHPRRDINSLADMQRQADPDLGRHHDRLLALAAREVRLSATRQIRKYTYNLAPFIVDPNAIQEGYLTSEPFTVEQTGALQAQDLPARPTTAIPATPTWCWCRRNGSTPIRTRGAGRSSTPPATAGCTISTIRAGQCADQARQSRHDRRHPRPGAGQDETLRAGDQRRRPAPSAWAA